MKKLILAFLAIAALAFSQGIELPTDLTAIGQGKVTYATIPCYITNSQANYIIITPQNDCTMQWQIDAVTTSPQVTMATDRDSKFSGDTTNARLPQQSQIVKYDLHYTITFLDDVVVASNWTLNTTNSIANEGWFSGNALLLTNALGTRYVNGVQNVRGMKATLYSTNTNNAAPGTVNSILATNTTISNRGTYFIEFKGAAMTNLFFTQYFGSTNLALGTNDVTGGAGPWNLGLIIFPYEYADNAYSGLSPFVNVWAGVTNLGIQGARDVRVNNSAASLDKPSQLWALKTGKRYVIIVSNASTEAATQYGRVRLTFQK